MAINRQFKIVPAVATVVIVAALACPLMAKKGGNGGGGGGNGGPPHSDTAASATIRDAAGDAVRSDGGGAYVDEISNLQVNIFDGEPLPLRIKGPESDRQIVFDLSQIIPTDESCTPPELLTDGGGDISVAWAGDADGLPAPGQTVEDIGGWITIYLPNQDASAGISTVSVTPMDSNYEFLGSITAIDADTFVWEVGADETVVIDECLQRYKGNRTECEQYIEHGIYSNCPFSITFTRLP